MKHLTRGELIDLFDSMYRLRQQMAENAGCGSFRDYAHRDKDRFDYAVDDCLRWDEAVREAVSDDAVDRMAQMKKQDMAEAAEQLLAATGWLPALMRTPRTVPEPAESPPPDAVTEAKSRGLLRRRE